MASGPEPVVEPTGKRGLSSFVQDGNLYFYGGYYNRLEVQSIKLDVFDFDKLEWKKVPTTGVRPISFSGCSCVVIKDRMYLFGGFCIDSSRCADVHELNLTTLNWNLLPGVNEEEGPFCKDKAGICDYGDEMLCIMGGYGYPSENLVRQKGASYFWDAASSLADAIYWTNELHLFHIKKCEWISPVTTGTRPLPCAAFSFNRVDKHRVVLFGGRQLKERTDHLYILDMEKWHWSGPIFPAAPDSLWPAKRSFHAACTLVDPNCIAATSKQTSSSATRRRFDWLPCMPPDLFSSDCVERELCVDPKLLITWGMDNDSDPVDDVWILNVNSLTWDKVVFPSSAGPARIWHTVGAYHAGPHSTTVFIFGGTDQNLFKYPDGNISNVQKSTLFRFGLSQSLFVTVLRHIAEDMESFAPLLSLLPRKLQDAVTSEHHTLKREKLYSFVHCNKPRSGS